MQRKMKLVVRATTYTLTVVVSGALSREFFVHSTIQSRISWVFNGAVGDLNVGWTSVSEQVDVCLGRGTTQNEACSKGHN